jgi:DNA-directed RNA polymerase specialized sigma24 family protein
MTTQITTLLRVAGPLDPDAAKRLFELMYADLKRLARSNLRNSSNVDELNTTVLVHESFLKYVEHGALDKADRVAFFAYVANVMRSVVVDFVRERQAQKRGGGQTRLTLTTNIGGESIDDERLAIASATATITEGVATPGVLTFSSNDVIVPLTGVANQQYVTMSLTNVASADGGTGGGGSIRVGFLAGDVNQNRVVTLADLGLVNAQLAQLVTRRTS